MVRLEHFLSQPGVADVESPQILSSSSTTNLSSTTTSSSSANYLTVTNLSYTILPKTPLPTPKPSKVVVPILNSISFTARSSEILAVVGPSGAGKSTLLRVVSGRLNAASRFDPTTVSFNGQRATSTAQLRKLCGYVTQEDNLLPLLTVRETLLFSSWFRLRDVASERERGERVRSLMEELGLAHVADRYVGDEETRGISGGERRRVSIAADVIHDPPVLLLDEPTSGLDSTSALQVVTLLASMARSRGQTVVLTIHQPGYRILQHIKSFLLLSAGTVAHFGTLESLEATIERIGYTIPTQLNALEFAMKISKKLEEARRPEHSVEQLEKCPEQQQPEDKRYCTTDVDDDADHEYSRRIPRRAEITSLAWRYWTVMRRTNQLLLARVLQAIVGGFGLASVYIHMKPDAAGVAERLGLFAFTLSFLLSSTVEALPLFLHERTVLMREVSRGMYSVSSYLLANTMVLLPFLLAVSLLFASPLYWLVGLNPSMASFAFFVGVVWMIFMMASSLVLFLGSVSPDLILGNSLIGVFLGVFFLFSGYFIPKDSIPPYWIFMYYVSPYRYPLDSLLVNEYWGMKDRCFQWSSGSYNANGTTTTCLLTGGDVLRRRGLERDTRWENLGIMMGFFLIYRVLSWGVLVRKASRTML